MARRIQITTNQTKQMEDEGFSTDSSCVENQENNDPNIEKASENLSPSPKKLCKNYKNTNSLTSLRERGSLSYRSSTSNLYSLNTSRNKPTSDAMTHNYFKV